MHRRGRALGRRYGRAGKKRALSVSEKHWLKIARADYKMPEPMRGVMGAMSREAARQVIRDLTGKDPGP